MQKNIHPKYDEVTFICTCGHKFSVRSTAEQKEVHLDVCSHCHPFFTGKQKTLDTGGQIARFNKRYAKSPEKKTD